MLFRYAAAVLLAAPLLLDGSGAALARDPVKESAAAPAAAPAPGPKAAREPSAGQLAGRERQKKCGAEWRSLSPTEKTAQGPKWPQFYSKCVKRLKEQKA